MALDKNGLKIGIKALMDELYANSSSLSSAQASEHFADQLSTLIDSFVKSGTPIVQGTGLVAGSNPVTGSTVTGTII